MRPTTITLLASGATLASGAVAPLHRRAESLQSNPAPITATLNSYWFDVEVKFGNQSFFLVVDTGSSDTWVAKTGYTCIEYISNQTFGVKYGTGIALGHVAYEDVTLGGITVPRQIVGIVDRTNDKADGINSGILGLGFPSLTSAHNGTRNKNDTISLLTNRAIYDPLFVSMYKKDLVKPWYSVAIERLPRNTSTGAGGWLGLGELPPVQHSDDWAVAPIEITKSIPDELYQRGGPEISLMTLTVDSVSWGSLYNSSYTTNVTKFQAVLDTGNNKNHFPAEIADSINRQFNPPAVWHEDLGVYVVDCDAVSPSLEVTIGGRTFWHHIDDMVFLDQSTNRCYTTVSRSAGSFGAEVNFLGDAFLKNVVSVFDFGKTEMRFAARSNGTGQRSTTTAIPTATASVSRVTSLRSHMPTSWFFLLSIIGTQIILALS